MLQNLLKQNVKRHFFSVHSSFLCTATSSQPSNCSFATSDNLLPPPRAIYFTGGGNFYYWQVGAALYLREHFKLSDDLTVVGASAGAITATLLKLDADFNRAISLALDMAQSTRLYERKTELALVWGPMIREWLHAQIPDFEGEDVCKGLHLTVTPALPLKPPKLVSGFRNKDDLIDAVMASIHVPVFLDGKIWTRYRGEVVLDGSFWWFMTRSFNHKTCPLPAHVPPERVFVIDWRKDVAHREKLKREILGGPAFRALRPNYVHEMVDAGYTFMRKQHHAGLLPWGHSSDSLIV